MSKKILLFDKNDMFARDVQNRLLLADEDTMEISVRGDINDLEKEIIDQKPDMVVIQSRFLSSLSKSDLGVPVRSYADDMSGIKQSVEMNIKSFGVIKTPSALIDAIADDKTVTIKDDTDDSRSEMPPSRSTQRHTAVSTNKKRRPHRNDTGDVFESQENYGQQHTSQEDRRSSIPETNTTDDIEFETETYEVPNAAYSRKLKHNYNNEEYDDLDDFEQEKEYVSHQNRNNRNSQKNQRVDQYDDYENEYENYDSEYESDSEYDDYDSEYEQSSRRNAYRSHSAARPRPNNEFDGNYQRELNNRRREQENAYTQEYVNEQIDRDLNGGKKKAKVITVYSAKGGVGKTTISTELAEQLALTYHGRGYYRVCIVDYNIDFGDVLLTLKNFSPKKQNMTMWAGDIQGRLENGERPEDINYTADEIEAYLQQDEQSGLYALIAPVVHIDSMSVKGHELDTMLRNIIENGNFDFVICDTGNNTRDSSYIALKRADDVLLVLTQDINSLNCNNSALKAISKLNSVMDMDKFKIVLNKTRKDSKVNMPINSVKAAIRKQNKNGGDIYYEFIAALPEDDKVRQATNDGEPVVFDSKNRSAFAEAIGKIAAYEIGDDFELAAPKKKSFFKRLLS